MEKSKYRIKVFFLVAGLLFVCFSFYIYQALFTANFLINRDLQKDPPVVLYIPTGATIENVKDSLIKMRIIGDPRSFFALARFLNYNEKVRPGRYLIYPQMSNLQVLQKLKRGEQEPVKVTFNNVRLKRELIEKLDNYLEPNHKELDSLMNDSIFVSLYGFDTTTIVSMFIPDTYEFYWNISPKRLFDKMNEAYKNFWNEDRLAKAKALNLTPVQVSILASIVEGETHQNSEKPRIAGVYLNRLKSNMLLQADPTVKYAVGDFAIRRVLDAHTATDSPYNTYKYTGLPPGPINLPSKTSLEAVLNAEKHDFIYFCASPTAPGFHDFAVKYSDHINNAVRYQKYLNKRKIMK